MESVIVLGAKGRFGRAAVAAFEAAGWDVTALARSWSGQGPSARRVSVDVTDVDALCRACAGHDVIVHAAHPPYQHWATEVPRITAAVIAAARASGATVAIPGNIYVYGARLPAILQETTPWSGDTGKGAIRTRMERDFRDSGLRCFVLRGGDFIEPKRTGNWFDSQIAIKAWAGKFCYPGPRDLPHAWAYLPDMARAMADLAKLRAQFDDFEEFGFGGYTLTGNDLLRLTGKAVSQELRCARFPWWALRVMSVWSPLMREVNEMRYLWMRGHAIDDTKLRMTLPGFVSTPPKVAIASSLAPYAPAHIRPLVAA